MTKNVTVTFKTGSGDLKVSAPSHSSLLELAQEAGIAIDAPCGGAGTCGKCRVRLIEGDLAAEDAIGLSPEDKADGWRLSCKSEVIEDVVIELPDFANAWQKGLKVNDEVNDADPIWLNLLGVLEREGLCCDSDVVRVDLVMDPPALGGDFPDNERVASALKKELGELVIIPLSVLQDIPLLLRENNFSITCYILRNSSGLKLEYVCAPHEKVNPCAIACDIGTTSVSIQLVDLVEHKVLMQASAGNAQIRYGADVINRIIQQEKSGGIVRLREAIVNETLNPLVEAVCEKAQIPRKAIIHSVFASNTTMNHLLLGIFADPIRKEPYVPAFNYISDLTAGDVGLDLSPASPVYIAPNVGSYVGGDITSGVLASELWVSDELEIFVDLGTNGELVFGNHEFLMTCACSAGPAFEGGDIRCGMRATDGAIEAVTIDDATFEPGLTVIGDDKPAGICGSGIIDMVAELFRTGAINGKGRFVAEGKRFTRDIYGIGSYIVAFADESATGKEVYINEIDLENFIRAKAAIFSALMTMLESAGFSVSDLSRVLVAGGIGGAINIENAIRIGLFPDISHDAYAYLGNSSLLGARAMAQYRLAREKVDEIGSSMTYLELSSEVNYLDAFVAASFLPHTDSSLFPSAA